jgi:predicted nucleic acid-binding Zn ribbon protein
MDNGKTEDDVQYLATCTYCGTQTRVNLRALEGDKPATCRMCGAELEIDLPGYRKRRAWKETKLVECARCGKPAVRRDVYYVDGKLYCAACNELLHRERNKRERRLFIIWVIIGIMITLALIITGSLTGAC